MDTWKRIPTLALVGMWWFLLTPAGMALQASSSRTEEGLKRRVEEFYSMLFSNRLADAEAYVARDSVENFRRLQNNPFVGFQVESMHVNAEGTSAEVEVSVYFIPPGGAQPLPFRRKSNWRMEDGEWRFFIPAATPQNVAGMYVPGRMPPAMAAPAPRDLRFEADTVNLGVVYKDEKPQARIAFVNSSEQSVRIEVETGCDCLRATKDERTYGPGESGEVTVEFDPAEYLFFYKQTILVKTQPAGRSHPVTIEAQVLPPESRLTQSQ